MQSSGNAADIADVDLGFKPLCVRATADGRFLLTGGSDNSVHMHTSGGVFVAKAVEKQSWVWACAARPGQATDVTEIVCGCEDGAISLNTVQMPLTHSLYQV